MCDSEIYQDIKVLAGDVVAKWQERGHKIAEGEDCATVVDKIANALFRLADADAVLLVTLEPRADKDGVHRLRNYYFGPCAGDRIVDMLNATRKVAADLAGLARKVNPKDLTAFLASMAEPVTALASITAGVEPEAAEHSDSDTEHNVTIGDFGRVKDDEGN